MLNSQRHLFDIPEDIAYFNCAYYSPLLNESVRRLNEGVISKSHPWKRVPNDFFKDAESIRELASQLFGGDSNGYAVIPSASYGLSTVARILEARLNKGDKILLLAEEFPSVVFPFHRMSQEIGTEIITVTKPKDGNWATAMANSIESKVKTVAMSSCHWTNGAFIDLLKVRQLCDELDAVLIIDATQSLGAMPFDMEAIRPDFVICAGYKWLLSPYGFTLFYVAKKWRNERPLEETWKGRDRAEDFANLANYSNRYKPGARRFDQGQKGIPTILPGAIAALEQIRDWRIEQIAETLKSINNQIAGHLNELDFGIPPDYLRCPHMLGVTLPKYYSGNMVEDLKQENIYISQRGNSLRFAPHVYITDYDIDRLINVIEKLLGKR